MIYEAIGGIYVILMTCLATFGVGFFAYIGLKQTIIESIRGQQEIALDIRDSERMRDDKIPGVAQ